MIFWDHLWTFLLNVKKPQNTLWVFGLRGLQGNHRCASVRARASDPSVQNKRKRQDYHVFRSVSFEFLFHDVSSMQIQNLSNMLDHFHKFLWFFVEGWVSQLLSLLTTWAVYGCQSQGLPHYASHAPARNQNCCRTWICHCDRALQVWIQSCLGQQSTAAKETLKSSGAGRHSYRRTHFCVSDLGGHQFDRPKADDLRPRSSASGLFSLPSESLLSESLFSESLTSESLVSEFPPSEFQSNSGTP